MFKMYTIQVDYHEGKVNDYIIYNIIYIYTYIYIYVCVCVCWRKILLHHHNVTQS
jgi:hypothetical protein